MLERFETEVIMHRIGRLAVRLRVVRDFDAVLDHYADTVPNAVASIPYYAHLWPSAIGLASHLEATYGTLRGVACLELGCGLGLPALVAATLGADVTAMDFHPDNRAFFEANAALNGLPIRYLELDWNVTAPPARYGLVMASDVLYENGSAPAFANFAMQARAPGGVVLLADPGRRHVQEAVTAFEAGGMTSRVDVVAGVFVVTLR